MLNSSISTLFSSFGGGNSSSGIYGSLSELASIRTGSYRKLAQKYYGTSKVANNKTTDKTNKKDSKDKVDSFKSTATSKENAKALAETRTKATDLKKSADAFRKTGTDSVFKQTDGKYDTDKIYSAVNDFVKNYNSVIEDADKSNVSSVKNSAESMIKSTTINSKMLSKIGISVGSDNKLTLDEEAFKKADMNTVKTLFGGSGSFGYQASVRASMIDYAAKNEAQKASTYNGYGTYSNNFNTGSIFSQGI